jgi:hypothetical protein
MGTTTEFTNISDINQVHIFLLLSVYACNTFFLILYNLYNRVMNQFGQ